MPSTISHKNSVKNISLFQIRVRGVWMSRTGRWSAELCLTRLWCSRLVGCWVVVEVLGAEPATRPAGAAQAQLGGGALHQVQQGPPEPPGHAYCLSFTWKCCERYVKVAEPQNGENIEQRAGGVSPGTRELCTRAEKVPRTKRVSFEVEWGKIFVGWKILGILRGSLGLCRQGRTARQHHRHRSIFSITRTLWHPISFWSNCVLAKFAWIDRRMWMVVVAVNNVKVAWLGDGVVVQCRLAIVWSPEHFYLVALQRGRGDR